MKSVKIRGLNTHLHHRQFLNLLQSEQEHREHHAEIFLPRLWSAVLHHAELWCMLHLERCKIAKNKNTWKENNCSSEILVSH